MGMDPEGSTGVVHSLIPYESHESVELQDPHQVTSALFSSTRSACSARTIWQAPPELLSGQRGATRGAVRQEARLV